MNDQTLIPLDSEMMIHASGFVVVIETPGRDFNSASACATELKPTPDEGGVAPWAKAADEQSTKAIAAVECFGMIVIQEA